MLVLALDTTTQIASVSLYDDKKGFIGEINILVKTNHSNVIMSLIDELFKKTNLNIKDVDKVAVSIGPGSFTGIRIGLAIAKGLVFGTERKIVGINELEMLAHLSQIKTNVIALIDARRERVYSAIYKNDEIYRKDNVGDLALVLEEAKKLDGNVIFIGDAAINYKDIIKAELKDKAIIVDDILNIPRSVILAKLGMNKNSNLYELEPDYVNKSQAERELENRLKKD